MKFLKLVGMQLVAVATAHALTLEEALVRADRENPAFQVLAAEVEIAQGAKAMAGTRPNPELTVGPGVVRATEDGRTSYKLRGELGISQTFEFPGKRSLRLLLADGEVRLRAAALDGFRHMVRIQVRQAFIQALVAREIGALRAEQLRTAETFLKSAQNRVASGHASAFELVQAQADRIAAARGVLQAKGETRSARSKLAQLMGSPLDTSFEVRGNLDSTLAGLEIHDPLSLALAKNPTLGALAMRVDLCGKAVDAARLETRPDLTVNPALEASRDEQALSLNFSLPLPILDRGRSRVATAEAERRRAVAELAKFKQELSASVLASRERVAGVREQLALYTPEFLEELKDILARTGTVYDQNATSLLMFLESRRSYYASLSDHYETIGRLAEAQSELATAIGFSETTVNEPNSTEKP